MGEGREGGGEEEEERRDGGGGGSVPSNKQALQSCQLTIGR